MKTTHRLLLSSLFATIATGAAVHAQNAPTTPGANPPPPGDARPGPRGDRTEQMKERMARHESELRQKLNLTPQQEPAWNAWVAAMRPTPESMPRPPANAASMTAPERMEQHLAMMKTHEAQMAKRVDATKTFYAQLTPEQKKTFDAYGARMQQGGHEGERGHGPGNGHGYGHERGERRGPPGGAPQPR